MIAGELESTVLVLPLNASWSWGIFSWLAELQGYRLRVLEPEVLCRKARVCAKLKAPNGCPQSPGQHPAPGSAFSISEAGSSASLLRGDR